MGFDSALTNKLGRAKLPFGPVPRRDDATVEQTTVRVAIAVAEVEAMEERSLWRARFEHALRESRFIPAARILALAGTERSVGLFDCFMMGAVPDCLEGIFEHLREAAITIQQCDGIGVDFSTIRPSGCAVCGAATRAAGPLRFMECWDSMCGAVESSPQLRRAMSGCLRIDHPDIEAFIDAARDPACLQNFNLSVAVPNAFMTTLAADGDWRLSFGGHDCRMVKARALWKHLMRSAHETAEPNVIFIDRVNDANNLAYCETITASNPIGEQMLPPYGGCLEGSINLARLVDRPFRDDAALDESALADLTRTAVRFLDNAIDMTCYPLFDHETEAKAKRRIGLGVTGLADALLFCGAAYGTREALTLTHRWLEIIKREAYRASARLAQHKGIFPVYDESMLERPNLASLDEETRALIVKNGLRNGCLTSIAPTGTTSPLADDVSSGIGPVFACSYTRRTRHPRGSTGKRAAENYAMQIWRREKPDAPPPESPFVGTQTLAPYDQLTMQATAQALIDGSVHNPVSCPEDISLEAFADIYIEGYQLGCKGLSVWRTRSAIDPG